MDPEKFEFVLLSFPVLLLAFCVHEFMHAWVALKQGDDTAYMLGRVTLDPRAHIDPIGSILFPLVGAFTGMPIIGWAKPTPTNPRKYRNYKRGDILVSIAGVCGNLGLAVLFALLYAVTVFIGTRMQSPPAVLGTAIDLFVIGVQLNVMLIFFNLLPVPPLDGSHVLYHLLPVNLAHAYRQLFPYGMFILYALLFVGALWPMWRLADRVTGAFLILGNLVAA
ncbi:MAG TPA: site-2 protease family protein [Longimicrobiaceae bacterium]|nr:site-2 protease family protein [Longimicrobiaceae bacterium]